MFPTLTDEEEKILATMGLDEEEQEEPQEAEEEVKEEPEEVKEEPQEEAKKPVEEPAKETTEEEDRRAAARYRWEASEAKRKLAEKEAEIEALKAPKKAIPSQDEDYEGHVNGRLETVEERIERLDRAENQRIREQQERQMYSSAINDLHTYESAFKRNAPDYDSASNHFKAMIATSIKVLQPNIEPEDLAKRVVTSYLSHARDAYNAGLNPAQSIYEKAKQYGYRKQETPVIEESHETKQFASVSANKKRSSGLSAVGGSGAGKNTLETVAKMSNKELAEFSRLNPEELDKLMYG